MEAKNIQPINGKAPRPPHNGRRREVYDALMKLEGPATLGQIREFMVSKPKNKALNQALFNGKRDGFFVHQGRGDARRWSIAASSYYNERRNQPPKQDAPPHIYEVASPPIVIEQNHWVGAAYAFGGAIAGGLVVGLVVLL